jgi:hypothetical protein
VCLPYTAIDQLLLRLDEITEQLSDMLKGGKVEAMEKQRQRWISLKKSIQNEIENYFEVVSIRDTYLS